MAIENSSSCDECGGEQGKGNLIYCSGCYSKLGGALASCAERIKELEKEITALKKKKNNAY